MIGEETSRFCNTQARATCARGTPLAFATVGHALDHRPVGFDVFV